MTNSNNSSSNLAPLPYTTMSLNPTDGLKASNRNAVSFEMKTRIAQTYASLRRANPSTVFSAWDVGHAADVCENTALQIMNEVADYGKVLDVSVLAKVNGNKSTDNAHTLKESEAGLVAALKANNDALEIKCIELQRELDTKDRQLAFEQERGKARDAELVRLQEKNTKRSSRSKRTDRDKDRSRSKRRRRSRSRSRERTTKSRRSRSERHGKDDSHRSSSKEKIIRVGDRADNSKPGKSDSHSAHAQEESRKPRSADRRGRSRSISYERGPLIPQRTRYDHRVTDHSRPHRPLPSNGDRAVYNHHEDKANHWNANPRANHVNETLRSTWGERPYTDSPFRGRTR